jgi:hypothetical protein
MAGHFGSKVARDIIHKFLPRQAAMSPRSSATLRNENDRLSELEAETEILHALSA